MAQTRQQIQAVVASEYPEVRNVLKMLAQNQGQIAVAGETRNEIDTVALARDMDPHVALIDYRLPYFRGLDDNPLSRIYGLSAARAIAEGTTRTTAVLITNADREINLVEVLEAGAIPYLRVRSIAGSTLMPLRQLVEAHAPSRVVFAELAVHHPEVVEAHPRTTIREKVARFSQMLSISGTASMGAGVGLLLSVIFAPAGVLLLGLGALGALAGLGGLRLSRFGSRGQS